MSTIGYSILILLKPEIPLTIHNFTFPKDFSASILRLKDENSEIAHILLTLQTYLKDALSARLLDSTWLSIVEKSRTHCSKKKPYFNLLILGVVTDTENVKLIIQINYNLNSYPKHYPKIYDLFLKEVGFIFQQDLNTILFAIENYVKNPILNLSWFNVLSLLEHNFPFKEDLIWSSDSIIDFLALEKGEIIKLDLNNRYLKKITIKQNKLVKKHGTGSEIAVWFKEQIIKSYKKQQTRNEKYKKQV